MNALTTPFSQQILSKQPPKSNPAKVKAKPTNNTRFTISAWTRAYPVSAKRSTKITLSQSAKIQTTLSFPVPANMNTLKPPPNQASLKPSLAQDDRKPPPIISPSVGSKFLVLQQDVGTLTTTVASTTASATASSASLALSAARSSTAAQSRPTSYASAASKKMVNPHSKQAVLAQANLQVQVDHLWSFEGAGKFCGQGCKKP